MQWQPITFNDESGSWLECEMPLGLCYAVAKHKRRWLGELFDSGGGVVWTGLHKTQALALAACEAHAEAVAKEWILKVGE